MSLAAGTRLGPYEVLGLIGAGGMGEVYKARDTRLDRTVAIKVLPAELSADPDRRVRFEREARAIASLSHPHICALFDIGESSVPNAESPPSPTGLAAGFGAASLAPVHYLVMEHLAGQTLADRLLKGPLPLAQALDIGMQLGEALDAAHKHGIIHRDLKPGNVMLTASGAGRSGMTTAKLLDFGLAKALAPVGASATADGMNSSTQAAPVTAAGTILGTLQYMAPEQLEGKEADARTDLWALGAILYEMVTGRRAFEGDSQVSLIGNIMNAEPPGLAASQPLTPPALERLVRKCLARHPDDRWQSARDLADELRWMRESSGSLDRTGVRRVLKRHPWGIVAAILSIGVILAAVGIAVWLRGAQRGAPAAGPVISTFAQLTDQPGPERFPSLSPDGKSFVYAGRDAGNWDIYLQRVGGRNAINLTRGSLADDSEPAFSPDGEWIAFRSERNGGGIFVMGATGESVRRVTDAGHNPAWSPDGREIAYATEYVFDPGTRNATSQIRAVGVLDGQSRLITRGDAVQPHWSPHGQRIAYWQYEGGQRDLATVPARGGTARAITNDAAMDWNPAWSPDGRYLYFSSNRGGSMNLWRVPLEEASGRVLGPFESVTTPSLYSGNLSFSRDGTRLAYADRSSGTTVRSVGFDPITEQCVGQPSPVPGPTAASDASPSKDGQWLAFVSGRNQDDVFVVRTDGTDLRQLTDDAYRDLGPRWSPDGDRILFYSNRSGRYQAWIINADGSGLEQLTDATDEMWHPLWSPDGRRVAAFDSAAGRISILDATVPWGRQAPQLLPAFDEKNDRFSATSWSPDGRLLAGTKFAADGRRHGVLVYSLDTGRYQTLSNSGGRSVWLRDSRRLLISAGDRLDLMDTQSGDIKTILSMAPQESIAYTSISADNRVIYLTVVEDKGNIWLASLK